VVVGGGGGGRGSAAGPAFLFTFLCFRLANRSSISARPEMGRGKGGGAAGAEGLAAGGLAGAAAVAASVFPLAPPSAGRFFFAIYSRDGIEG